MTVIKCEGERERGIQILYLTGKNKCCNCLSLSLSLPPPHRVWEKIAEGIQLIGRNTKGLKKRLSSWAKGIGYKGNYAKQSG